MPPDPAPAKTTVADDVVIRPATLEESAILARLMVEGLNSRLHDLGPRIVVILHETMATSRHCVCLVAEQHGQVLGYVSMLISIRRFYREFMLKRGLQCALVAARHLSSTARLRTVLGSLLYLPRRARQDAESELISLVVSPSARRRGVATKLFEAAVDRLPAAGVKGFTVGTGGDNGAANAFYLRHGCRLIRTETLHDHNVINVYAYGDV